MSVTILPALGGKTLTVSMAFGANPDGDPAGWTWTDVTAYVLERDAIQIVRGRRDEAAQVEPTQLTFAVANSDGRFTPDNTGSPYYPNVTLRVPVKIDLGTVRFSGFVDEWPIDWPGGTVGWSTASVRASGMWRRLAQSPPFKSMAEELLTYLDPSSYYPMTDGPSALAWADRSGNNRPDQAVTNWTPGGVDYTSLNTDQSNGGVDRKSGVFYPSTLPLPVNGPQTIAFTGHAPAGSASFFYYAIAFATHQQIADLQDSTGAIWRISDISNTLTLQRIVGTTATTIGTLGLSGTNPVLINWTQSGSNVSVVFWTLVGSVSATVNNITVPTIVSVVLYPVTTTTVGEISSAGHVALYDDAMTADELTLLSAGFSTGQIADPTEINARWNPEAWIRSRARLSGYRDSAIVLDSSLALLDYQAADAVLGGKGRVEAMRVAADGELGLLYETLTGGVGFRNRASRYVSTPWLTVDMALGDVASPPQPTFDDQNIVNDVTVTQRQGQGRYVDQASVDRIGLFQKSVSSIGYQADNYSLDFDASQMAAWIVNTHSKPRVRIPQLTLRLSGRSALADAWVAGEPIGSRIDVTNVPPQLGVSSLSFFIEGYTETITMFEWLVTINCSPVDPYDRLFKLEDATLGHLDLDGQTLAGAQSTSSTSWSVTTAGGKPLLATTSGLPGSFPFDLDVNGEQVRVTAVTGAVSPQTATVTRSVNGVVKAQTAGTVLKLWRPGVMKI